MPAATSHPGFCHLHLHTEYSLLDGGNKITPLLERVKELGMDAVAVTDHGNLHGAIEFYTKAKAAGVKPILGIEAYVAPGDRREKEKTGIQDGGFHLVLLAENDTGWRNLLKLSSDSFINGFYYKPRMDKSTLAQWSDGLIAINGHLGSSIAHHLLKYEQTGSDEDWRAAVAEARWHAETFGKNEKWEPRFFIELQYHDVTEQQRINPHLIRLARELDLPLVVDNDAHYLRGEDWDAHDSLCCISMSKNKDEQNRLRYSHELYVKSPEQMAELCAEVPESLENSVHIAERCNVDLDFATSHAPVVKIVYERHRGIEASRNQAANADLALPSGEGAGGWREAQELTEDPGEQVPSKADISTLARPLKEGEGTGESPLPSSSTDAAAEVASFTCEHVRGSTEWFKAFCRQFDLEPYDTERDHESAEELKQHCDGALRLLCEAGLIWRYGEDGVDDEKRARLDRELTILADKSISAYFLIVWDFVNWARQNGIPALARGSGVGTMVGYVLGLSNACPIEFGLLFERFTDPDRSEYPDIDIDICQDGRGAVINYVREKYGHVAQIITFGRLKAKAAIKDVARVMGLLPAEGQRLANLVPNELNITLDEALEKEPDLRKEYKGNPTVRSVVDTARALENHARHAGVHAAGVVVATQPLDNIVPLCKATGSDDIITQWDGPTCEKLGLLKMDFLGLRTLSTVERAVQIIKDTLPEQAIWEAVGKKAPKDQGIKASSAGNPDGEGSSLDASMPRFLDASESHPLDLERITYDDPRVYELFQRGDTAGIFQFESGGMRKLLLDMKPDRLEDLIAANALFRPGPMDLIPDYCMRKHGRQPVPKLHPIVDDFTEESYGIMIYQEQVMQIVHGLGDIPLRSAYTLIKAISKKKEEVINAERPKFIEGAKNKGLSATQANDLFDLILKFAGYGFNKSHSTGYAIVAYQTAYLKTYFPNQYMAAVLTFESAARKVEDWVGYLHECRKVVFPDHTDARPHVGVDVLPPDINKSESDFTVVFDEDEPRDNLHGHVRFGLSAIKGVGRNVIGSIIDERRKGGAFRSVFDFCERLAGQVNKAVIEALVKCGTFDELHGQEQRSAVFAAIDQAISAGQSLADDRRSGQMNMFMAPPAAGAASSDPSFDAPAKDERPLPNVPPWDQLTMLAAEKEVLGIHLSGHPLDRYARTFETYTTADTAAARELPDESPVVLGGMLTRVRQTFVRNGPSAGEKMAMITLSDTRGTIDGVVFSGRFAEYAQHLVQDSIILLVGRIDTKRGEPQIIVDQVIPADDAPKHLAGRIELDLASQPDSMIEPKQQMEMLAGMLAQASATSTAGRTAEVWLRIPANGHLVTIKSNRHRVSPTTGLLQQLRMELGETNVREISIGVPRSESNGRGSKVFGRRTGG